jgi:hypothetical protein
MGVPQAPRAGDGWLRTSITFATCFAREAVFPTVRKHRLVPALLLLAFLGRDGHQGAQLARAVPELAQATSHRLPAFAAPR